MRWVWVELIEELIMKKGNLIKMSKKFSNVGQTKTKK